MKKINNNKKILLLIMIVSLTLFSICFYFLESDYLWHIKAGEYMFKNGIIKHDVFSWYLNSKYWMSHEWLFEILIYFLKYLFGNTHIFIYSFLSLLLLHLILFFSNKGYTKNVLFSLVWIFCFLFLVFPFVQVRPHLISFNFLAITIWLLYDLFKNEDSKKIYFLPLISILWSNIHGGSSNLSYLLIVLFIFAGLFNFKFNKIESHRLSKKQFIKYVVVMIICIGCVCINIHGIKMLFYPYENMLDTTMLNNINEWRGTTLNSPVNYIYFAFLLLIVGVMLLSKKRIQFIDLILFLFVAYLGIKSVRFWFYTYIVMTYVVFNYIDNRKMDEGTNICIYVFSIMLVLGFVVKINTIFNNDYYYLLDKKIIKEIKREKPKRLFNMYNYGGDLIYRDIPVFVDGRADLYGKYNYKDYLDISVLNKKTPKLLKKYNFDYYLVDKNYPIYTYIKSSKEYILVYQSKKYAFYKKN